MKGYNIHCTKCSYEASVLSTHTILPPDVCPKCGVYGWLDATEFPVLKGTCSNHGPAWIIDNIEAASGQIKDGASCMWCLP